jgi:peptidoglycan hydrolase FlgJ
MAAAHALASPPAIAAPNMLATAAAKSAATSAVTSAAKFAANSAVTSAANSAANPAGAKQAKAHATAVNFEAQFLNSMFGHMFTDMEGDGPLGGGTGVGVWRSFLSEQYAKSFAKAGGIGIADHVYRALIAQQEAHAS